MLQVTVPGTRSRGKHERATQIHLPKWYTSIGLVIDLCDGHGFHYLARHPTGECCAGNALVLQ